MLGSSLLVCPHEVELWLHSWYRGRIETFDEVDLRLQGEVSFILSYLYSKEVSIQLLMGSLVSTDFLLLLGTVYIS